MENLPSAYHYFSSTKLYGSDTVQKTVMETSSCSSMKMLQMIISLPTFKLQMLRLINGSLLPMRRVKFQNERVSAKWMQDGMGKHQVYLGIPAR